MAGTNPAIFSLMAECLIPKRMLEYFHPVRGKIRNMESTQTNRFNFLRTRDVLLQPLGTFRAIVEEARASWLTPMLLWSASTFLCVMIAGFMTARAASMGEMLLPRDWQYWTPDMQNNYMQAQQSMQGPVFSYVIPLVLALVSLWGGWLILSGLLHLGSTLLGGRGTMQGALTVAAWAGLPFVLRDLLRIIFMVIAGHAIQSPGLSGFAGSSVFLGQILSRVDVFFIWYCILLVIGFEASEDLPRNKAIAGVTVLIVLLLLVQAGLGTLFSNLGGLAFQRPF
jgi:hypothetical protein